MGENRPGLVDEGADSASPAPLGESATPRGRSSLTEQADRTHRMTFEDELVFDQFSVSKYASIRSVFREFLTNSGAACLKARERLDDSYSPTIHVAYYPNDQQVVIEDNGMGISRDELQDMLNPGRSPNRHNPKLPGKYGIGRLSAAVATGADGGYRMESTSRLTGETILGIWEGLDFSEYDSLERLLGDDQFGTRFDLPLKEDTDVREHLDTIAPYFRIPVLYTEHGPDGSETFSEEYGGTRYTMDNDPNRSVVYETDCFRAVVGKRGYCGGNEIDEDVVVLDAPIDSEISLDIPFPYDHWCLLLKEESERIVAGPNKGLIRISNSEYDAMDADERDQYIPHRDCTESDIYLPTPVGDRDRLHENEAFANWLGARLTEATARKLRRATESVLQTPEVTPEVVQQADFAYFGMVFDARRNPRVRKTYDLREFYIDKLGERYPDERVEALDHLIFHGVEYCPPGAGSPTQKRHRDRVGLWRIFYEVGEDADVFMSIRPTRKKVRVIREDSREHVLIRVKRASKYEQYEQYGFRKLKTITDSLDEFDCSPGAKEAFRSSGSEYTYENHNAGKEASERRLNAHFYKRDGYIAGQTKWDHDSEKVRVADLRDALDAGDERVSIADADDRTVETPDEVVLFPPSTDYNLSEYQMQVAAHGSWAANCAKMTADYLYDLPSVRTIDEVLADAESIELTTPEGTFTPTELRDADQYDVYLLHTVDEVVIGSFRARHLSLIDEAKAKAVYKGRDNSLDVDQYYGEDESHPEIAYVPLTVEELRRVYPIFGSFDTDRVVLLSDDDMVRIPDVQRNSVTETKKLYASYRLRPWEGSELYKHITGSGAPHTWKAGYEIIELLASFADQGHPPTLDDAPFDPFDPATATEEEGR